MDFNNKLGYLFIFITLLLLCLSVVSAHEANDTNTIIKEKQSTTNNVVKEDTKIATKDSTVQNKKLNKTTKNDVKTASRTPTSFNIKITNNLVDDARIEIGVIDYNTDKAIPNSKLSLLLPDKTKINTKSASNGYANVTMKLPYGNNTIHIDYPGTSKYYEYDYDLKMEVIKRNVNMTVNIEKTNDTGDVKLTIKLTDLTYNDNIKNVKTTVKISDGRTFTKNTNNNAEAKYNFKLNGGKHTLNVSFPGNNKYTGAKTSIPLDMGKIKNNVDYDVELNDLYVGKSSVSVTVKDYVTKKILPNTQLKIKIENGKTYTGKTDKNGVFTTKIEAPVGKNYMNIIYDGNSKYNNRTSKINFTVKKRVSNMNFTFINSTTAPKLSITLKDLILNRTINNANVVITLPNGQKVNKTTNTNGEIKYPITIQDGTKEYRATFNGNAHLTNVTNTLTITKQADKIPVTYNVTVTNRIYKDDNVVITLIDTKTNKTIANAPLTIKLVSKTINSKTNSKGQVTLKKSLKPGTNNVTLIYKGNNKYSNNTSPVDINIKKRPSTLNSSIRVGNTLGIDIALTDAINHNAIPNAKLVLKHPKINVTLTTDKNGRVVEDIKLPAGKAEISVVYSGNSVYSASNVKPVNITITSPKTATKVTVNKVKGTIGEKVTITANIKDVKGNKINGGNVVFKLNGKTLKTDNIFGSKHATKKVTVKNGKASVKLTATKTLRDSKSLTVTYSGTDKYYANVSKAIKPQIQLRTAKVVVTVAPKTQQQHKTIIFKVKVTDTNPKTKIANNKNSFVIFKINGKTLKDSDAKTLKVQLINQTATYKYKVPGGTAGITLDNTIKNHVLTAVFYNPNYSSAKNTTTFHVNRSSTKFNITTLQYSKKTGTLTIKGNIKDYKNYNVVGDTKINVKLDGKTITQDGQTVNYTIKSGRINLEIKVPNTIKTFKNVSLISGDRLAYTKTSYTTKNIKQV